MPKDRRTWILVGGVLALASISCCSCTGLWAIAARQAAESAGPTPLGYDPNGSVAPARQLADVVDTSPLVQPAAESAPIQAHPADSVPDSTAPTAAQPAIPVPVPNSPVADLQALGTYATTLKPILDLGLATADRDGQILKAAEGKPELLCGGAGNPHPQLVADAALMHDLVGQLGAINPPPEARTSVHEPLTESARLWGKALESINDSCRKGPLEAGVLRLGAAVQAGSSMLNFRLAYDNFWRLALANGLEALVGPAPQN